MCIESKGIDWCVGRVGEEERGGKGKMEKKL
jgi:hypothetical protein